MLVFFTQNLTCVTVSPSKFTILGSFSAMDLTLAILFLEITREERSLATVEGLGTPQGNLFRSRHQDLQQEAGLS